MWGGAACVNSREAERKSGLNFSDIQEAVKASLFNCLCLYIVYVMFVYFMCIYGLILFRRPLVFSGYLFYVMFVNMCFATLAYCSFQEAVRA